MSARVRVAKRLIGWIVRLYPESLRRAFGEEMTEVLAARYRELRARGRVAAVRDFWLPELRALLRARRADEPAATTGAGSLASDVRVCTRSLLSSPAFSLAAVLLLALSVGGSTAVFSVTKAVLFAPLPFADPEELVLIFETNAERGWTAAQASPANFLDWRADARTFESMTAYEDFFSELVLDREGEPTRVRAVRVFGDFFEVLGAPMTAGRGFTEEETWRGVDRVAVLSTRLWRSQLGARDDVIGTHIDLEGESYLVVGVAAPSFRFPFEDADLWIPMGWDRAAREAVSFRRAHSIRVVGRLASGVALPEARSELASIATGLSLDYPETNEGMGVGLAPLLDWLVGDVRPALLLINLSVLVVLALACANVSTLFLMRFGRRAGEMSLRAALGAGWRALARLAVVESTLVAAAGGTLGVLLAWLAVPVLVALAPPDIPRLEGVRLDTSVLAFALLVSFATAFVCGVLPAIETARSGSPARRLGTRASTSRASRALVTAEIALAVLLSMGAVLLGRSFENARRVDPGFDLEGVTTATLRLPAHRYATPEDAIRFSRDLLERLHAQSSVTSATVAGRDILNAGWSSDFTTDTWGPERYGVGVQHRQVAPGYFETLRVPLVAGRDFSEEDGLDEPPVVVVNEALADAFFPGKDPVGKRICYDRVPEATSYWRTIIGVVGNERHLGLLAPAPPTFIEPLYQGEIGRTIFVLVRSPSPASIPALIRGFVAELDASVPVFNLGLGASVLGKSLVRERFLLTLMGLFAASGLLVSVAGIYSVLSFAVSRRTREIGIRMALGARGIAIARLVVGSGLALAAVGTAIGMVSGVALARIITTLLHGVAPSDGPTLAIVAAAVLGASILASLGPALRAARTDPVQSVRTE